MPRYDIDALKAAVTCPALLETNGWKVDLRESTPRAIKYRRGEGEIIVVIHQGRGWFDPTSDAKGDVLSLAQRLGSPDFASAAKAVADLVGFEPSAPAWQRKSKQYSPGAIISRWSERALPRPGSAAWSYLTLTRAIPEAVVSAAVAAGRLREGPKGSIWAGHFDASGIVVGWEERGPNWRGFARGGGKALFSIGSDKALRLCVTEAAIDAISLAALEERRPDSAYASTGGGWAPSTESQIRAFASRPGAQIVAASDGNDQGDTYAERLRHIAAEAGAQYLRLWPDAEDWNEHIQQSRAGQTSDG